MNITTDAGCTWTAVSNAPWITIANPTSGSGNATVRLDIQANTGPARNGTATVAAKTVTVNQESGCTISISPTSRQFDMSNGNGSFDVTAGAGCTWVAVSGASWVNVTGNGNGSGSGTVMFKVDKNTTGKARSGTIAIDGQIFTVNQAGS